MGDDSTIHLLYGLLIGALTIALSVIGFFLVRTINQIDQKAEKSEISDLKEDIRDLIKKVDNISDQQTKRHEANTTRLDNILLKINGIKNGG